MGCLVILGASGFIGRHCIATLRASQGLEVVGVSRQKPSWASKSSTFCRWECCDVLDTLEIDSLFERVRPTHLLNLAWYSGADKIWSTTENLDWVAASLRLATSFADKGGRRLVMAGSCAEYGGSGHFNESDEGRPDSLYGIAKRSTRETINIMAKHEGMSFAWPRLFHMYGPHEDTRRLVSSAICALLEGREFACSDGNQVRDFLHIEDVASALVTLVQGEYVGTMNIGSGQPVTLRRLLEIIGDNIGRRELLKFGAKARTPHDPDVLVPLIFRQAIDLGWLPKHTLQSGVANTVHWWRDYNSTKR